MATTNVAFRVLDVGQGTGNFIEVYDGTKVTNTVLVDLGSARGIKEGGPAVEYVIAQLTSMAKPKIDALFLSHSDQDHINLILDVLKAFPVPATDLVIGTAFYSGIKANYTTGKKTNKKNVLDEVAKYIPGGTLGALPKLGHSFKKADTPIATVGDLKLFVLVSNTASNAPPTGDQPKKKKARIDPNVDSLVVVAQYAEWCFVATGDATCATLDQCNVIVEKYPAAVARLAKCLSVTVPHHGSWTTALSPKAYKGDPEETLEKFVKNMHAGTITASAAQISTYKHPSARILSYFWLPEYLFDDSFYAGTPGLPDGRHFYTAYFTPLQEIDTDWPPVTLDAGWYAAQTKANVFTTNYYTDDEIDTVLPPTPVKAATSIDIDKRPRERISWLLDLTKDATLSITTFRNTPALVALRAALAAGVPAEELPIPDVSAYREELGRLTHRPLPGGRPRQPPAEPPVPPLPPGGRTASPSRSMPGLRVFAS